jgi:hypothetical protein
LQAEVVPALPSAVEYRWYINGQLVETTSGNFLSTRNWPCTSEGEGLSVMAITGCGATSPIYGGTYSPICYGYRTSSNLKLYPNPASSKVTIRLEDLQVTDKKINSKSSPIRLLEIVQVKIIDKTGLTRKLIKFQKGSKAASFDISELVSDLYYLDISDGIKQVRVPLMINRQ